jgi:endonuclease/exonuclease/phosphatase family metal-dependent hydrolase
VYVVAYKFVPGGEFLRERSKSLAFLGIFFSGLGAIRSFLPSRVPGVQYKLRGKTVSFIILVMLLAIAPASLYRYQKSMEPPAPRNHGQIRTLAWAIHFGYDNNGRMSLTGLADVMTKSGATVIGLVETDSHRTVMANRDVIEWLADELHFYQDFGPSPAQNTWGCALLSLYPIQRVDRVVLPSPQGELACLIDADVVVNGTIVNVVVSHFGNTEDTLDLDLQTDALAEYASKNKNYAPTLFIGYLTTDPYAPHYNTLIQSGWRDTSSSLDRYCLYLLYKDMKVVNFERYDKGNISDTEAQVGSFVLVPQPPPMQASPEFCRNILDDSVKCQEVKVCGWCQLASSGFCYEPQQQTGCELLTGAWVGPTQPIQADTNAVSKFAQVEFEQQKKGRYPIAQMDGNTFVWTVNNFAEIDSFAGKWTSAVFEAKGQYWRLAVHLHRKRDSPRNRNVEVGLENVTRGTYSGRYTLALIAPNGKKAETTTSSSFTSSGNEAKLRMASLAELQQSFLQNDSFKVSVTFL